MEPIDVTAQFDQAGNVRPSRFTWKKGIVLVESTGRQWLADDGWHVLVLDGVGNAYELVFVATERRWYLRQATAKPASG